MPELHQSIAQHYHERTKYNPQTITAKNKGLDWSKQPVPFKEYKIGSVFDLKPYIQKLQMSLPKNRMHNGGKGCRGCYFVAMD